MQDRVGDALIVGCPGCDLPMEAKERTSVTEGLVDIRYVYPRAAWKRSAPLQMKRFGALDHR